MGKSSRAKKAKKADFHKVKLKVGKKLQKAQNETTTEFKAKKIILKEQLALKSTATLVTKNQHNIKELLSHLSYHNVYVRQDGIDGLRELINRYEPSVLLPHLSTFITRGVPCILDSDPVIRNSATKYMETLIMKMGPSIEPYFNILATHLACAMVHLNVGVQGDSLKLMRVLIKHTPKLIACHANTVLNNFLNLIARKTKCSTLSSQSRKPAPKVTFSFSSLLQPSTKNPLAGHMGRLSLLVELSNFLEAILAEQNRIQEEIPYTTWEAVVAGSIPPLTFDPNENRTDEVWLFTDVEKLQEFTNTVMCLLMQLWIDVDSSKVEDISTGGNALNEEGVETLSCIVKIMMHIWKITQICTQEHPRKCPWLQEHFASDFLKRIMSGYPYCCHVTPLHMKKKKNKHNENKHQDETVTRNLKHCDDLNVLLTLFGTQMAFKSYELQSVNFMSKLLRDGNRDGEYSMKTVVQIIKEIMPHASKSEIETIIRAAHVCFVRLHPLKKDRSFLLVLLLEATDIHHQYMWNFESVEQWIQEIVKNLKSGDVRESLLSAAVELRLRDNTNIKSLLFEEKLEIAEAIKAKGVQGLTPYEVDLKLHYLLKD